MKRLITGPLRGSWGGPRLKSIRTFSHNNGKEEILKKKKTTTDKKEAISQHKNKH